MKEDVKVLRVKEIMRLFHLTQTAMSAKTGIDQGNLSGILSGRRPCGNGIIDKIALSFPDINREWLLYGEGEMLKSTPAVQQNNVHGDNNYNNGVMQSRCPECGGEVEIVEAEDIRRPIIPTEWTYQTDIDLYEKVQRDKKDVSRSRFIALDVPIDMWHIVRDDSLLPDCKRGDLLALKAYPIGKENPIPGKIHAVDTRSNGMIVRILEDKDYGYRATAPNSSKYPEMRILKEDIIRVYRIVCMARIAI